MINGKAEPGNGFHIRIKINNTTIKDLSNKFSIEPFSTPKTAPLPPRIDITSPNKPVNWKIGQTYPITWKTYNFSKKIHFFNVEILKKDKSKVLHKTGQTGSPKLDWTVPTGVFPDTTQCLIRVRTSNQGKKVEAFSPVITISPDYVKKSATIPILILNRHSSRRMITPFGFSMEIPLIFSKKPGLARVGHENYQDYQKLDYVGFLHRSRLWFNLDELKGKPITVLEADLILTKKETHTSLQYVSSCAGWLYVLTGNWAAGKCIDTPGYRLTQLPRKSPAMDSLVKYSDPHIKIDIKDLVNTWLKNQPPPPGSASQRQARVFCRKRFQHMRLLLCPLPYGEILGNHQVTSSLRPEYL